MLKSFALELILFSSSSSPFSLSPFGCSLMFNIFSCSYVLPSPVNVEMETLQSIVIEEEEKPFKDEAIDDLLSEIRDDDKSIEMPQVERDQITQMPSKTTTSKMLVERNEVGQMTSTTTEAEAIPLAAGMANKSEVGEKIKVSTACGPSPDREIEEVFLNEANVKPIRVTREISMRSSISIGTSPPPQNISTQVNFNRVVKLSRVV